ncbi:MAG: cyclic nucleotide-binding domain-containing protein [Bacteroidales bacterium]|nr:cyclic nucleotide-binding domain-containing protein [Bacteroidales bacterium]
MTDYGSMTLDEKVSFLKQVRIFADTGEVFLLSLATVLQGIKVKPQQTILKKGEPGDAMYIVTSGTVRIHDGSHVLSRLTVNDVFGEYALIDEGPRSASVTTEEESYFLRLRREDFENRIADDPGFARGIMKVLILRMRNMNELEEKLAKSYIKIQKQKEAIEEQNQSIKEAKDKLEEQNFDLLNLNEEKNHLLSVVVHGMKNPLTSSLTMIDMMLNDPDKVCEEHRDYAEIILNSLQRMNKMINQVLDINVIESKVYQLNTEKINLKDVVEKISNIYKHTIEQKDLKFQLSLEELHAELNEVYILQIVDNLVSNAIKYTPSGKSLSVKLGKKNSKVLLEVKDTGIGIPKQLIPGIFDQYERKKHHLQQLDPDTGLGLAIVKKYVDAMNGRVWCESEHEKGSSFFVEFDLL